MGGVHSLDRALSDFRPRNMGKIWYWNLLVNMLNIFVVYTWRLCELLHDEKLPQKYFQRKFMQVMVQSDGKRSITRPRPSCQIPDDVCFDSKDHYPISCPNSLMYSLQEELLNLMLKMLQVFAYKYMFQQFHQK